MTEYGDVIEIKKGIAMVRFCRTSACGSCRACGMMAGQNDIVVEVQNTLGAAVGQQVEVSITTGKALRASAIAYIFPLLMLALGVLAGWLLSDVWHVFANSELTMALCAIIFAILSFLLLKIGAPLYNGTVKNVYTMIRIREE